MQLLITPFYKIVEEVDEKQIKIVNPKNTYEEISVISIEDLYDIFNKHIIGEEED